MEDFLSFLEWILFTVIRLFPYVIVLVIVLPIFLRIKKLYRKRHHRNPKIRNTMRLQSVYQEQDGKTTYVAPDYIEKQSSDDDNLSHN